MHKLIAFGFVTFSLLLGACAARREMPPGTRVMATRDPNALARCVRIDQVKIESGSTVDAFERAQYAAWDLGGNALLILIDSSVPYTYTDATGKIQTYTKASLIGEAWRCPN